MIEKCIMVIHDFFQKLYGLVFQIFQIYRLTFVKELQTTSVFPLNIFSFGLPHIQLNSSRNHFLNKYYSLIQKNAMWYIQCYIKDASENQLHVISCFITFS